MKITHVTTRVVSIPADNPLVVGLPASTDTRKFVTLELGTDEGSSVWVRRSSAAPSRRP